MIGSLDSGQSQPIRGQDGDPGPMRGEVTRCLVMKSDQESSITALKDAITRECPREIKFEESPVGESEKATGW